MPYQILTLTEYNNKGGISIYSNHINKWTGGKLGTHRIIKEGIFIHGPHIHPWI